LTMHTYSPGTPECPIRALHPTQGQACASVQNERLFARLLSERRLRSAIGIGGWSAAILVSAGHEVDTVPAEGLTGAPDPDVLIEAFLAQTGLTPRALAPVERYECRPSNFCSGPAGLRQLVPRRPPTSRLGLSSQRELLASSRAEPGGRASRTPGSGVRTVDLLLARGEH
jgi:hypothetical protein